MRDKYKVLFTRLVLPTAFILAITICSQSSAQTGRSLKVAVTLPDLAPIVKSLGGNEVDVLVVMPAGADPHGFTLTADAIASIESCDFIVYGNSGFLHFESELAEAISGVESIDWPDYQRHNATLKDFSDYDENPHGFWLGYDNAIAIATGIAEALVVRGVDSDMVTANLVNFISELDSLEKSGKRLFTEMGRDRSVWVAMVPGVLYIIDNLGLGVGGVVTSEGGGFASGSRLMEIENKLIDGDYAGLVCPLSMKDSKAGEMAEQIAKDTNTPMCYVRFLDSEADDSYLAQASYNMGAIGAAAAQGIRSSPFGDVTVSGHLIWGLIVFGLLIALVMQNSRVYRTGGGAGVFDKNKKSRK